MPALRPEEWSPALRWGVSTLCTAAFALTVRAIRRQEKMMKKSGGPGIVPFALAATPERAREIKRTWGDAGVAAARKSLHVDFAFIASYILPPVVFAGFVAAVVRGRGWTGWASTATWSGWAWVAAGMLDVAENVLLLHVLGADQPKKAATRGAALCARAKFGLLGLAGAGLLTTAVAALAG